MQLQGRAVVNEEVLKLKLGQEPSRRICVLLFEASCSFTSYATSICGAANCQLVVCIPTLL